MGRSKGPGGPQPVAAGEVAADAGELPVVGRQHRDPVSPGVQYIYMSPQGVYAVGVQHHRLLDLLQQIQHQLRDAISPAQSRAQSHCVTAGSPLQDFLFRLGREPPMFVRQREWHGRDALGRLHRPDGLRHPQGHQPAPGPHRRRGSEIRRTGIAHCAADDQHLAEGSLVAVRPPGRQGRTGKVPLHRLGPADKAPDQIRRDADVPDLHVPGEGGPLPHCLTDLGQCEGDSAIRPNRTAQHGAGVRRHAAGNVRRHHGGPALIHPVHRRGKGRACPDGPGEAHAEEGVDHHVAPQHPGPLAFVRRVEPLQLHTALAETAGLLQGVRRQLLIVPYQERPDLQPLQKQQPGCGDSIAAVVARAAQGRPPTFPRPLGQQRQRRLCHACRRPLHQVDGGNAPLFNGLPVQLLHLLRRRQLHGRNLLCSSWFSGAYYRNSRSGLQSFVTRSS